MRNLINVMYVAATALILNACLPATTPPTADGGIDPLEGTPCTPGAIEACVYPCWSAALRVCPVETSVWTRCTPDETHGMDTCAPAPCTGPAVCSTPCGNSGLRACDTTTGMLGSCDPIFPAGETCDAGVLPVDGGPVPADAGTDAGDDAGVPVVDAGEDAGPAPVDAGPPPVDAGPAPVDAGPLMCGGCTDRAAGRVCATRCGFAGGQTCGECLSGLCCHPIAPSLETCPMADPVCVPGSDAGTPPADSGPLMSDAGPMGVDAGMDAGTDAGPASGGDAGPMSVDAGTDAPVAMADAGSDAGPAPVDAGTDAPAPVDAGTDAPVAMADAGSDAGPAPVDAGSDAGPAPVDAGTDSGMIVDAGPVPMPPASGVYIWLDPATWCPTGGTLEARLWDNTPGDMHDGVVPLTVPVGPMDVMINASDINNTVFCRTGAGLYEGYISPRLTGATVGTDSTLIGARVYINGVLVPSYICWDTSYTGSTAWRPDIYKRLQFRATLDPALMRSGCMPGTATP